MAHKRAFISYRREAWVDARAINSGLKQMSVDTFIDVDNLRQSHFDEQIFRHIDENPNFILIVSPGALDRCNQEDDWVRKEVAYAISKNKNIVPVCIGKAEFPPKCALPQDIESIIKYQSVKVIHDYFDESIERLISYLRPDGESNASPIMDGVGKEYLHAIVKKISPGRLPVKPLSVEEKPLKNGALASWKITNQYFFAVMVQVTRSGKVDIRWGVYSENRTKDPPLRHACRQLAKSLGSSDADGIFPVGGCKYRLESFEDYLGLQTSLRLLPSDLAKPEVQKLHAGQLLAFIEIIWPLFEKYLLGVPFLKGVLAGVDQALLPFSILDRSSDGDIVKNLEANWHVAKRHYFSARLSDALKVQWGLYSKNKNRDRPLSEAWTELQQVPGLTDRNGNLVISGTRYKYKNTNRYQGIVASETRGAEELRDGEFIKAFSGQLRGFMNVTWPAVQKHLANQKPQQ